MKYLIILVSIFLINCSNSIEPCTPVDVKTEDGYCFIPMATNMDIMQRQCGIEFYDDCQRITRTANYETNGHLVYGTCERQYKYIR